MKAYDQNASFYNTSQNGFFAAGYQDLGYGSAYFGASGDPSNGGTGVFNFVGGPNGLAAAPGNNNKATTQQPFSVPWQAINGEPIGFGHEGRIPPLTGDFRLHPRRPTFIYNSGSGPATGYHNLGDDSPGVQRLTRVWDSWSTDYTNAPDTDLFLNQVSPATTAIYPSFPAPYPTGLRGIQIQIRVSDPRNERVKSITIRHDFTDKL